MPSSGGYFTAALRGLVACIELCIAVALAVAAGALAAQQEWMGLAAAAVFLPATLIYAAWVARR